jgi:hypothetical protein
LHQYTLIVVTIAKLIVVCCVEKNRFYSLFPTAEPTQLLASTVDYDQTDALGHLPWFRDEASLCGLGVALPQSMQSAIAPVDCCV